MAVYLGGDFHHGVIRAIERTKRSLASFVCLLFTGTDIFRGPAT